VVHLPFCPFSLDAVHRFIIEKARTASATFKMWKLLH